MADGDSAIEAAHHLHLGEAASELARQAGTSTWRILLRVLILILGAIALYGLAPQLIDVWAQVPELRSIEWIWFVVMIACEAASLACTWLLIRIALPQVPWFVAATAQMTSNAVTKIVPAGGAFGAATQWRMLSVSGVDRATAASTLAATSLISTGVLFALPFVSLLLSILGAPVPESLSHVAWGGAALFVILFGLGALLVTTDRPLEVIGAWVERVVGRIYRRLHKEGGPTAAGLVAQRDQMVRSLGPRWKAALGAAVGNWLLDYMALVAALYAVGSEPRLSLVLLAYATAAVLAMIPITPGGLGFVEAGLVATLTLAGVPASDALLATLAYRVVSYWLPLPAGLVANLLFRRRYGATFTPAAGG